VYVLAGGLMTILVSYLKHVSKFLIFFPIFLSAADEVKIEDLPKSARPLVEYIIDSSGSMAQDFGPKQTKMVVLKKLIVQYLNAQWNHQTASGLSVFGSTKEKDCQDIQRLLKPGQSQLGQIELMTKNFEPKGMTPIGLSLEKAYAEIKKYPGPKKIVLLTDGEETCGKDPCQIVEKIKELGTQLDFLVVTLGLQDQTETLLKLQCVGDLKNAKDEQELEKILDDLDKELNPNKNLFVVSPDPNAQVQLYLKDTPDLLYRTFKASMGIEVPPGEYLAVVKLKPEYKFLPFSVPSKKKVTLTVKGDGYYTVNFAKGLLTVELLNQNNKIIKTFKSDSKVAIPTGNWKIRIFRKPFYEKVIDSFRMVPKADQFEDIEDAGFIMIEGKGYQGYYIFKGEKNLLGHYLLNSVLVLPKGIYQFVVNDECKFSDMTLGGKRELVKLRCPNSL
jgi:Ca-activated chloride channel homolog